MADSKLSSLTQLAAAPAGGDWVYIVDISEPATDQSKRITIANLLASLPATTLTGKLTAGAVEIEGSNFDINGGTLDGVTITAPAINGVVTTTGLTMPAFTLGGTLTLNNQAFDAGALSLRINTTSPSGGLSLTSTQDSATGATLGLYTNSASPAASDVIGRITGTGVDATPGKRDYNSFDLMIEDTSAGSEAGKMQWRNKLAGAWNVAMTLSGAGELGLDLGVDADEYYKVAGTQVVSARGAAVANPTDAASTQARLIDLLGRLRTHGLIAT